METADMVKKKRKVLNLTQKEMGKILGKDRSTVAKYETGKIDPPGSILVKITGLKKRK